MGPGGWSDIWSTAWLSLENITAVVVVGTLDAIVTKVVHARELMYDISAPDESALANTITAMLARGLCHCGHHVKGCTNQQEHRCCRGDHALKTWKPAAEAVNKKREDEWQLKEFIARAVSGSPALGIYAKRLGTSMLYPLLNKDKGILVDSVEFKICPVSHPDLISKAEKEHHPPKLSEVGDVGLFEGSQCNTPGCHFGTSPSATYRVGREWIFYPDTAGGAYEQHIRWKCTSCGNLVPSTTDLINIHQIRNGLDDIDEEQLSSVVERWKKAGKITDEKKVRRRDKVLRDLQAQVRNALPCPRADCGGKISQRPTEVWVINPRLGPLPGGDVQPEDDPGHGDARRIDNVANERWKIGWEDRLIEHDSSRPDADDEAHGGEGKA